MAGFSQADLRNFAAVAPQTRLHDWVNEWDPLPRWLERAAWRTARTAVDLQERNARSVRYESTEQ